MDLISLIKPRYIDTGLIEYELTPDQLLAGWSRHRNTLSLSFHDPRGLLASPASGVPAVQEWRTSSNQISAVLYTNENGILNDHGPEIPAWISWHSNAAAEMIRFMSCGKITKEHVWLKDGRKTKGPYS